MEIKVHGWWQTQQASMNSQIFCNSHAHAHAHLLCLAIPGFDKEGPLCRRLVLEGHTLCSTGWQAAIRCDLHPQVGFYPYVSTLNPKL